MNEGRVDMCDSQCRCNFLTPTSKSTSISVSVLFHCCSIVEVGLNGMKSHYIASIPEFQVIPLELTPNAQHPLEIQWRQD